MFKTTVNYLDFNDKPHTEDLYFHMLVPEFADLEFNPTFGASGGLSDYVKEAMRSGDGQKVYTFFKLMIVNSYGRRSEDGSQFVKKSEFTEKFLNSRAYEEFFMNLVEDAKFAEQFWNGIVPAKLLDKVEALEGEQAGKKKLTELTKEELVELLKKKTAANEITSS